MNTNPDYIIATPKTVSANPDEEVCKNYRLQPVLACNYLLQLKSTWTGTRAEFLEKAEKLTRVKQAHVYRILKFEKFIEDFGALPPEQQPSWSALQLLARELRRHQMMDAWMTAVWSNGGTSSNLNRVLLRDSMKVVAGQSIATRSARS